MRVESASQESVFRRASCLTSNPPARQIPRRDALHPLIMTIEDYYSRHEPAVLNYLRATAHQEKLDYYELWVEFSRRLLKDKSLEINLAEKDGKPDESTIPPYMTKMVFYSKLGLKRVIAREIEKNEKHNTEIIPYQEGMAAKNYDSYEPDPPEELVKALKRAISHGRKIPEKVLKWIDKEGTCSRQEFAELIKTTDDSTIQVSGRRSAMVVRR